MPDDANIILHRIEQENADAVAAKMAEWFTEDTDAYDLESVADVLHQGTHTAEELRELARKAI